MALQPAMKGDVSRTPVKGAFNDHGLILVCGVVPHGCVLELIHHGSGPLLKTTAPARDALALPLVRRACVAVSFRPVSACALGFSVLGIPVCLTAVQNPAGGFRVAG